MSLKRIFVKYKCDKYFHKYDLVYDKYFSKIKNKKLKYFITYKIVLKSFTFRLFLLSFFKKIILLRF